MGSHRIKCPSKLQTCLCKHATRSFNGRWISIRGLDPMKRSGSMFSTKLSKQMMWVTVKFHVENKVHSGKSSRVQDPKFKGANQWIQWFLKYLGAFRILDPSNGALLWIPWLPEILELPSGVPTDPRVNWRLKANFLWTTWLSCFEVCTFLSDTLHCHGPKKYEGKPKMASTLWNLEIVPWNRLAVKHK